MEKSYFVALRKRENENDRFWKRSDYSFKTFYPKSERYWLADPFLFEDKGITYLFCEAFDRYQKKGVICCSKVDEYGVSEPLIIIDEPFHMSFPYVFRHDGKIFMMPETAGMDNILIYEAIEFPACWTRRVLVDGIFACDSIFAFDNGKKRLLTSEMFRPALEGKLVSCYVKNRLFRDYDALQTSDVSVCVAQGDYGVRNAGACFFDEGKQIRPGQECTDNLYGNGLVFFEITSVEPYREQVIATFTKEELNRHLIRRDDVALLGTHTYNASSRYEVVDYAQMYSVHKYIKIGRFLFKVRRKLKRILNCVGK